MISSAGPSLTIRPFFSATIWSEYIVVIHDINFASVYSDHIVALKNGRIVKEGPAEEIIETTKIVTSAMNSNANFFMIFTSSGF
jgi:ABC-type enterochelin transport system ATPase subunit